MSLRHRYHKFGKALSCFLIGRPTIKHVSCPFAKRVVPLGCVRQDNLRRPAAWLERIDLIDARLKTHWIRKVHLDEPVCSPAQSSQFDRQKHARTLYISARMSLAISVHNVSKLYRLGEINRGQLFSDLHRWWTRRKVSRTNAGNGLAGTKPDEPGDFWALKDVSLDIEQGKTIGLVGGNGAGKTTLLKIISRITAPTKGSVRIKGRVGSLLEVGTGFHPDLTGRDNVFLYGTILGMNRAEVKSKFDDIVGFAELEQFIDTPIKHYSSGMYVRLAFAVSAFLESEIIILDEVFAVGDIAFRTKCYQRLEELIKARHTILFVAHEPNLITRFCDSAIWLHKGSIEAYGPVELVANDYQNAMAPADAEVPILS